MHLLAIFERLKAGDLHEDAALLALVSGSGDPEIQQAGLALLGRCASGPVRMGLVRFFDHPHAATRQQAWESAGWTGDLRQVPHLLTAYRALKASGLFNLDRESSHVVVHAISHLLEADADQFCESAATDTPDEYAAAVLAATRRVEAACGDGTAVLEGRPLSLAHVLDRLEQLCREPEPAELGGTICGYLDLVEAMTGWPVDGALDHDQVAPHVDALLAMLSRFRASGRLAGFIPGRRYFFGHLVT